MKALDAGIKNLKAMVKMYDSMSTEEIEQCTWGRELHVVARNIVLTERRENSKKARALFDLRSFDFGDFL